MENRAFNYQRHIPNYGAAFIPFSHSIISPYAQCGLELPNLPIRETMNLMFPNDSLYQRNKVMSEHAISTTAQPTSCPGSVLHHCQFAEQLNNASLLPCITLQVSVGNCNGSVDIPCTKNDQHKTKCEKYLYHHQEQHCQRNSRMVMSPLNITEVIDTITMLKSNGKMKESNVEEQENGKTKGIFPVFGIQEKKSLWFSSMWAFC